jgi:hypothetical protein
MSYGRRAFLQRAAGFAAAGVAGYGVLSALGCSGTAVSPPQPGLPWGELARRLSGSLVRPGDAGFARLALPNNLRYANVLPAGIAMCDDASDVSTSIAWAREHGVPLVARSGGHSYAGYSTTRGLMIDLRRMNAFTFDHASGIATLGGGARNKDVFEQCRALNVAITHGRCEGVGVAGLTLGGGVGFNMRLHGLTCDQLVATDIVTADGKKRTLGRAGGDRDLLWACRGGGGGNFGINTALSFQTFEVGRLAAFDLRWNSDTQRIFGPLVRALESAPNRIGCKVTLSLTQAGGADNPTVQLLGQLAGTTAELNEILAPVFSISPPSSGFVRELSYWDAQDLLSDLGAPEHFAERSRFFENPLDDSDAATIFSWLRRWPGTVKGAAFKLFQTGGRVNAVAPASTAFVHRKSEWLAAITVDWEGTTPADAVHRNLDWQRGFYDELVPLAQGGAYQNFIDPSLTDWQTAYYGTNLPRLRSIKKRVDPAGVFTFPEAIP